MENLTKKVHVPDILVTLSDKMSTLNAPLYIVGGYIRNTLLGTDPLDIDICARLTIDELLPILNQLNIKVAYSNTKMGTLKLRYNSLSFEYATLRYEDYKKMGARTPHMVQFVDDIKIDAMRRDFTINALYYDIKNEKIIDNVGGLKDLEEKLLVEVEHDTLDYDATRLLRMIKYATLYNLSIEDDTFLHAKNNLPLLNELSKDTLETALCDIMSIICDTNKKHLGKILDELSIDTVEFKTEFLPLINDFLNYIQI